MVEDGVKSYLLGVSSCEVGNMPDVVANVWKALMCLTVQNVMMGEKASKGVQWPDNIYLLAKSGVVGMDSNIEYRARV